VAASRPRVYTQSGWTWAALVDPQGWLRGGVEEITRLSRGISTAEWRSCGDTESPDHSTTLDIVFCAVFFYFV
jgi:hypothetical protein